MATNLTAGARERGRALGNRKQSDQSVADNWDLLADLFRLRAHGATLRDCAANLNDRGIKTRRGKDWTQTQVMRLLDRVAGRVEFIVQKYSARGWHDVTGGFERYQEAEQAMERLDSKRSRSKPRGHYRVEVYSKATTPLTTPLASNTPLG